MSPTQKQFFQNRAASKKQSPINPGVNAVRLVAAGRFGRMVSYIPREIEDVALEDVMHNTNSVPADADLIRTARSLGICLGD